MLVNIKVGEGKDDFASLVWNTFWPQTSLCEPLHLKTCVWFCNASVTTDPTVFEGLQDLMDVLSSSKSFAFLYKQGDVSSSCLTPSFQHLLPCCSPFISQWFFSNGCISRYAAQVVRLTALWVTRVNPTCTVGKPDGSLGKGDRTLTAIHSSIGNHYHVFYLRGKGDG